MHKLVFTSLLVAAVAAPVVAQAQTPPPSAPQPGVAAPAPPSVAVPTPGMLPPVFVGQQQTPPPPPPPQTVPPGRGGRGQATAPPTMGRGQATPPPTMGRGGRGQATPLPGRGSAVPPPTAPGMQGGIPSPRPAYQVPAQNIRVELTIGDSAASRAAKKSVSMLLADGHNGRIRSGTSNGTLNVDGTARAGADGRILLEITLEYVPDRSIATAQLNESISVVVQNGQSTLVSRSADPASDRSVTLEVVATIVK